MRTLPTGHQIAELLDELTVSWRPSDLDSAEFSARLRTMSQTFDKLQHLFVNLGRETLRAHQADPFTSILCEDRGGRLPAVFIRSILAGTQNPIKSFFPYRLMVDYLETDQKDLAGKIRPYLHTNSTHPLGYSVGLRPLIVTERIVSGLRVGRMIDVLRGLGVEPTVAVLSFDSPNSTHLFPPPHIKGVNLIKGGTKASSHYVSLLPLTEVTGLPSGSRGDIFMASGDSTNLQLDEHALGLSTQSIRILNFAARRYMLNLGREFLDLN